MNEPNDNDSPFDILDTQYGREALGRLVEAMLGELRQLGRQPSSGHVRLWASQLLLTCRSSQEMYNFGAEDRKNLERIRKAAEEAVIALHQLSPWLHRHSAQQCERAVTAMKSLHRSSDMLLTPPNGQTR